MLEEERWNAITNPSLFSSEDIVGVSAGRGTSEGRRDGSFHDRSDGPLSSGREYLFCGDVVVFSERSGRSVLMFAPVAHWLVCSVRRSRVTLISDAVWDSPGCTFGRSEVEDGRTGLVAA